MKRTKLVSALIAFVFVATGYTLAIGQDDPEKTSAPQTTTAEQSVSQPAEPADHSIHHPAKPADSQPAPAGHDMSKMSGMGDMNKQDEAMMAHMKSMRAQMEKIKATENPAERKKLMQEHMAAMGSGMKMMREMDGKMMQSGKCPMMEMMSSPQGHAGMKGMMGDMTKCHRMMQKKSDMHYDMMEQIIESQEQLLELSK